MLDRAKVRATFERRFSVERMANDYLSIYRGLPTDAATQAGCGGHEATIARCMPSLKRKNNQTFQSLVSSRIR
jgi:hypothetical protein